MLTPQQAREELDRLAVPDALQRRGRKVGRLLGPAGRAGRLVLDVPDARGRQRADVSSEDLARVIDELSDQRRAKLCRALHPTLGDLLAAGWQDLRRDPYTSGYARRGFRAPTRPDLTGGHRLSWLRSVVQLAAPYEQPVEWFAAWGAHLPVYPQALGRLLAVAVDRGHDEVFQILLDTVHGRHPVAQMGRHVVSALLAAGRPDGWQQVEQLLLAAQRQEGLRQVVMESVDLAHPEAFGRIVRLVGEQGLTRFAAVIRGAGVWLGEPFEVTDRRLVDGLLGQLSALLDDPAARQAALAGDDPGAVRLALWAQAFLDAPAAAGHAARVLDHASADCRLAAMTLLQALQLPETAPALARGLDDPDLRVAATALTALPRQGAAGDEAYTALRRLVDRLERTTTVVVGTWKPTSFALQPAEVADTVTLHTGDRSPRELDDVLGRMSPTGRGRYAGLLAEDPQAHRDALLALLADRSDTVRSVALRALEAVRPSPDEAPQLEALLTRKSADLRRALLGLLARQPDPALLASIRRLLAGRAAQQRAGRELLAHMRDEARSPDAVAALTADLGDAPPAAEPTPAPEAPPPAPALVDDTTRTPAVAPGPPPAPVARHAEGIARVLRSLDAWVAEHRDVEVSAERWSGSSTELVGNLRWLPQPNAHRSWDEQQASFPLAGLLEPWWERTAPQLSDGGLEVVLATAAVEAADPQPHSYGHTPPPLPRWIRDLAARSPAAGILGELSYTPVVTALLPWFAARELQPAWIDALLDGLQGALAAVPAKAVAKLPRLADLVRARWAHRDLGPDWRTNPVIEGWWSAALTLEQLRPHLWTPAQRARLWQLVRFLDEPQGIYQPTPDNGDVVTGPLSTPWELPGRPPRHRATLGLTVRAVSERAATETDLVDLLVGERTHLDDRGPAHLRARDPLGELTRRRRHHLLDEHPWLEAVVVRVRDMIVETELQRGDLATPVTGVALQLRGIEGAGTVVGLLAGLGSDKLVRGYLGSGGDKPTVFSKLIRGCFPAPGDTPASFAAVARQAGLPDGRLRELAVYAPQWGPFVEAAIGWPGLADAVHWLHAHTKDDQWRVDADVREEWAAETHQRTPLTPSDLVDGAVDVAWFHRLRAALGDERFDTLLKAASYASSAGGHKRAELFARALRGDVDPEDVLTRMNGTRHQDSVRAYGLVPLPENEDDRRAALLGRYEALQRWKRDSSRFGQQRRASEGLAVRIGLANLARNAGYRDPQRLQWAMEAEAVRDLAAGPVSASKDDVTVTLSIGDDGAPRLDIRRGERVLKNVPKAVAKAEPIAALTGRASALRTQTSRVRAALEEAAVRGDAFAPDELAALLAHPMLAPMLASVVVTTAEGVMGLPRHGVTVLTGPDGQARPADGSSLRLAHPVDLLESREWHHWQRWCFAERTRQPFKQVFRELYVLTDAERADATRSRRYAGQQVNPRQAAGLFGARGWVMQREEGALRTFHDEQVTAVVGVLGGWATPAEVEGMTLEDVMFLPAGGGRPLALEHVPARLFSEVMRDLDLVVSVAHAGGVDPEASASTVELRAALVRETLELLGLDKVELTDHHALITGQLGSYSVHLGSGSVHRRPGNAVCIVPVGSQHRGRLFLPFADDDPRTAEVVAKVVLLARDGKIKDPTVLEQLRS